MTSKARRISNLPNELDTLIEQVKEIAKQGGGGGSDHEESSAYYSLALPKFIAPFEGLIDTRYNFEYDMVIREEGRIQRDPATKTISLQSFSDKFPKELAGGTTYLVAAVFKLKDHASGDGTINYSLIDASDNTVLKDINRNDFYKTIATKKNEPVDTVLLSGAISVYDKGLNIKPAIRTNLSGGLNLADHSEAGGCSILVQAFLPTTHTSIARTQWETDTGIQLYASSHNMGGLKFLAESTMHYKTKEWNFDKGLTFLDDCLMLHGIADFLVDTTNRIMEIKSKGNTINFIQFGMFLRDDVATLVAGKVLDGLIAINTISQACNVYVLGWMGETRPIWPPLAVNSHTGNGEVKDGWLTLKKEFVAKLGTKTINFSITVPFNITSIIILIAPVETQEPIHYIVSDMQFSVKPSFTGVFVKARVPWGRMFRIDSPKSVSAFDSTNVDYFGLSILKDCTVKTGVTWAKYIAGLGYDSVQFLEDVTIRIFFKFNFIVKLKDRTLQAIWSIASKGDFNSPLAEFETFFHYFPKQGNTITIGPQMNFLMTAKKGQLFNQRLIYFINNVKIFSKGALNKGEFIKLEGDPVAMEIEYELQGLAPAEPVKIQQASDSIPLGSSLIHLVADNLNYQAIRYTLNPFYAPAPIGTLVSSSGSAMTIDRLINQVPSSADHREEGAIVIHTRGLLSISGSFYIWPGENLPKGRITIVSFKFRKLISHGETDTWENKRHFPIRFTISGGDKPRVFTIVKNNRFYVYPGETIGLFSRCTGGADYAFLESDTSAHKMVNLTYNLSAR